MLRFLVGNSIRGLGVLCFLFLCISPGLAAPPALSQGQLIYVPAYSQIYFGDRPQTFNLSVTLSLRNTDLTNPIEFTSVRYYDEKGKLMKDFAPPALALDPLASARFYVKESDVSAGSQAFFLVRWQAAHKVTPPIVTALMVGAAFGQGISFIAEGRVLQELPVN
jgi:hypothetical protein